MEGLTGQHTRYLSFKVDPGGRNVRVRKREKKTGRKTL